jgi:hypothetical protein
MAHRLTFQKKNIMLKNENTNASILTVMAVYEL